MIAASALLARVPQAGEIGIPSRTDEDIVYLTQTWWPDTTHLAPRLGGNRTPQELFEIAHDEHQPDQDRGEAIAAMSLHEEKDTVAQLIGLVAPGPSYPVRLAAMLALARQGHLPSVDDSIRSVLMVTPAEFAAIHLRIDPLWALPHDSQATAVLSALANRAGAALRSVNVSRLNPQAAPRRGSHSLSRCARRGGLVVNLDGDLLDDEESARARAIVAVTDRCFDLLIQQGIGERHDGHWSVPGRCTEDFTVDACHFGDRGEQIPELNLGQSTQTGPFTCKVADSSVSCTVTATGSGFTITSAAITLVGAATAAPGA